MNEPAANVTSDASVTPPKLVSVNGVLAGHVTGPAVTANGSMPPAAITEPVGMITPAGTTEPCA
jgi:hypothetical protein